MLEILSNSTMIFPMQPLYQPVPPTRDWSSEVRRDQIDLRIELKSQDETFDNELPEELYMTHRYKMVIKLLNYWDSMQKEPSRDRAEDLLIFSIELLESSSLEHITDHVPAVIEGDSIIRVTETEVLSPVTLKIKFLESNYRIKSKVSSLTPGVPQIMGSSHQGTSSGTTTSTHHNHHDNHNANNNSHQFPPALVNHSYGNGNNNNNSASPTHGSSGSGSGSYWDQSARDQASLRQQLDTLNMLTFDYFRLRVICYRVETAAQSGDLSKPAYIDLSASDSRLIPVVSKLSAPFKVYSKKQHSKKTRKQTAANKASKATTTHHGHPYQRPKSQSPPSSPPSSSEDDNHHFAQQQQHHHHHHRKR